jgi:ribosomal protein L37AE/L43A
LNKIEQAIEYLQPISESATVGRYGTMLNIAIEALKEKAEREKGCAYCNPNLEIWHYRDIDKSHDRSKLCPICGRNLTKDGDK